MTNDYFNHDVPLARQTVARAESMNDLFAKVQSGFAKMPEDAVLKEGRVTLGTDSGSANQYEVSLPSPRTILVDGMHLAFKAAASSTGASTLNLDGLGAVAFVRPDGRSLIAGDIVSGGFVECRFDGNSNRWLMVSQTDVDRKLAETARDQANDLFDQVSVMHQTVHNLHGEMDTKLLGTTAALIQGLQDFIASVGDEQARAIQSSLELDLQTLSALATEVSDAQTALSTLSLNTKQQLEEGLLQIQSSLSQFQTLVSDAAAIGDQGEILSQTKRNQALTILGV